MSSTTTSTNTRSKTSQMPKVDIQSAQETQTKRKNQKSRNGCITCKKKRLKCDETKPNCENCGKKGIVCGGYSTNFRWIGFKESGTSTKEPKGKIVQMNKEDSIDTNASKTSASPPMVSTADLSSDSSPPKNNTSSPQEERPTKRVKTSCSKAPESKSTSVTEDEKPMKRSYSLPESDLFQTAIQQASLSIAGKTFQELQRQSELMSMGKNPYANIPVPTPSNNTSTTPTETSNQTPKSPAALSPGLVEQLKSLPSPSELSLMTTTTTTNPRKRSYSNDMGPSPKLTTPSNFYMQSNTASSPAGPSFSSLVKAFTEFDSIPSPLNITGNSPRPVQELDAESAIDDENDDKTSIISMKRANSVDSIFSNGSIPQYRKELLSFSNSFNNRASLDFRIPIPNLTSLSKKTELNTEFDKISTAFDKYTCAIMSIKDGPTENPWRTVIWPMALDHSVLFKSLASMTLLHIARNDEETKKLGMIYMKQAINELAQGLTNDSLPIEVALATCIALTVTESWSTQVSTGIAHLRGAKSIINKALTTIPHENLSGTFKTLCNIFVYHDVLARIVSSQLIDSNAYDENSELIKYLRKPTIRVDDPIDVNKALGGGSMTFEIDDGIDPLLGCAKDLFLIIGRTASLITKTRSLNKITLSIVSNAVSLKTELEKWEPKPITPKGFVEDPLCDVSSIIATAESYRYATLLYLHQAIPEIPSQSSKDLAEKVLMLLASIPTSSKTCLLHIFPLLVASCEMNDPEDREWIENRWQLLTKLMWIGNIDRAIEVVKEVWKRKDSINDENDKKGWSMKDQIDALTADKRDTRNGVNSWTHWSTVMKEWGWEVLLG